MIFLPYVSDFLGITLPNKWPNFVFPLVGLLLSIVFLYVSLGYAVRLKAIGDTYQKLIDYLPVELKRCSLADLKIKGSKLLRIRLSIVISIAMYACSAVLSIVMMVIG